MRTVQFWFTSSANQSQILEILFIHSISSIIFVTFFWLFYNTVSWKVKKMIQIPCKDLGYPEDNKRMTQTFEEVLGLLPSFLLLLLCWLE